jgi:HEAT repeat protein
MKPCGSKIRVGTLACALTLASAVGINAAHVGGSAPMSVADALRAKGIDLSRPSLLAALRNSDPQIRGLAAMKLAENHDADAIPEIKDALAVEKNPTARINFGLALWSLQDPVGLSSLRAVCSDGSMAIDAIVEAVQELNMIHESSEPCASTVIGFLEAHQDSESRLRSLFALADLYPWVTPGEGQKVLQMLLGMLSDDDPSVRMQTAQSLVQIGLPASAGPIRAQMLRETDPTIRDSLQTALDMLARKR